MQMIDWLIDDWILWVIKISINGDELDLLFSKYRLYETTGYFSGEKFRKDRISKTIARIK